MRISAALPLVLAMALPAGRVCAKPAVSRPVVNQAPPNKPEAPRRAKVSCAQYRADVTSTASHAIFDTRLEPGSWGKIPPELRKLPRPSKLCGADRRGQVVIASPLFGQDLESYYAPLLAKIGFDPLNCTVENRSTHCTCKRHRDIAILVTDENKEAFVLAIVKR